MLWQNRLSAPPLLPLLSVLLSVRICQELSTKKKKKIYNLFFLLSSYITLKFKHLSVCFLSFFCWADSDNVSLA